ncbi:MAG: hypothetical protein ACTSW1_17380 [Candidatus Hodarchaeales archaeon]
MFLEFEKVIEELANDQMRENFKFIHALALIPKPKIAFHASDADGIVSAAILKNLPEFKNAVYIPLYYSMLKHPEYGDFLKGLNWLAIVDLPPFNREKVRLYCDHHQTNDSLEKNAELIIFDSKAPSAASLLSKHYNNSLPRIINHFAKLTEITDTASYTIAPPVETKTNFSGLSNQEQAWLLDDLCKSPASIFEALDIMESLVNLQEDIFSQPIYLNKIKHVRTRRKKARALSENIEVKDAIVIIQGRKRIFTSALVQALFERGVKLTCIIFPGKMFVGVSLRLSPSIDDENLEKYRVDKLAEIFDGGGHTRAAGGRARDYNTVLNTVIKWIEERDLSYQIVDFRSKKKTSKS